jgi:hypothetical protein
MYAPGQLVGGPPPLFATSAVGGAPVVCSEDEAEGHCVQGHRQGPRQINTSAAHSFCRPTPSFTTMFVFLVAMCRRRSS